MALRKVLSSQAHATKLDKFVLDEQPKFGARLTITYGTFGSSLWNQ